MRGTEIGESTFVATKVYLCPFKAGFLGLVAL